MRLGDWDKSNLKNILEGIIEKKYHTRIKNKIEVFTIYNHLVNAKFTSEEQKILLHSHYSKHISKRNYLFVDIGDFNVRFSNYTMPGKFSEILLSEKFSSSDIPSSQYALIQELYETEEKNKEYLQLFNEQVFRSNTANQLQTALPSTNLLFPKIIRKYQRKAYGLTIQPKEKLQELEDFLAITALIPEVKSDNDYHIMISKR